MGNKAAGRPCFTSDGRMTNVTFRATVKEHERYEKAAEETGYKNASAWIRAVLDREAAKEKEEVG